MLLVFKNEKSARSKTFLLWGKCNKKYIEEGGLLDKNMTRLGGVKSLTLFPTGLSFPVCHTGAYKSMSN